MNTGYPWIGIHKKFGNGIIVIFVERDTGIVLHHKEKPDLIFKSIDMVESYYTDKIRGVTIPIQENGFPKLMSAVYNGYTPDSGEEAPRLIVLFINENDGIIINTNVDDVFKECYRKGFIECTNKNHWRKYHNN